MADQNNSGVTESTLAMWRTALALAYIDGKLTNSEIDLIHQYTQQLPFSDKQRDILDADIRSGVKFEDVFHLITDNHDISNLINFARVLFYIDGDFSEAEHKILDSIDGDYLRKINLPQVLKDANAKSDAEFNQFLADVKNNVENERKKEGFLVGRVIDPAFSFLASAFDELTGAEYRD